MLSARVRDQLRGTLQLRGKVPAITSRLRVSPDRLRVGFAIGLAVYLLVKLIGIVIDFSPLVELALLPAGACALGLAVSGRKAGSQAEAQASELTEQGAKRALMAGAALVVFTVVYLGVNTVPTITSQDESAIVNGAHELAANGSLRVVSPLNDRYHTNVIGALHVMYRTPTEMYYRTFPGTAALYAPFSVLPQDVGYRLFTALFGIVAIAALYLVAWKLLHSWWGALVAALIFAVSPAFGHWAVTAYNNVPALALELSALAIVLWSPPQRAWRFGAAGALMSVAAFTRTTELVYVVPVLGLVLWRTRALRPFAAFGAASLAGVALIATTNQLFYGDPLFLPHVGSGYLPLQTGSQPAAQPPSAQVLLNSYAQFATGTVGSVSHYSVTDKLQHVWFHVRYLFSSTFAFPFLAVGFVGLTWRALARRRDVWLLIGALFAVLAAILALYGQEQDNYYGFGQSIVRASFVRYSLPFYALLAVGAGAFFVDARQVFRDRVSGVMVSAALIALVGIVGIAHSYDASVYGFNRLNAYRQDDRAAWSDIEEFLNTNEVQPLIVGGPSVEKLITRRYELSFINYDMVPPILRLPAIIPVAEQATADRDVYVITSDGNAADRWLATVLYTLYRPEQVLHTGEFRVHRWRLGPASYGLVFLDVWNTYQAFDRWEVTDAGFLKSKARNSYLDLLIIVDADGDGRVDQDVTIEAELLDRGPAQITISALDSREGWQPVLLWSGKPGQTDSWRTATFSLNKGAHLKGQLIVNKGVTIRSVAITGLAGD